MTHTPARGRNQAVRNHAVRNRFLAMGVALALVSVLGACQPTPTRNDRSKPVLLVHGFNLTSTSTDCGGDFDQMIATLRANGFTGPMVKVGYYSGDVHCDMNLHSYGSYGDRDSWKSIAKAFSTYVYNTYTSKGVAVDMVGYSMGGNIVRGAVWGAEKAEAGFSKPIDAEDVLTLGGVHNGAAWFSYLCLWGQCSSLKPGATDINWLNQNGNPQGLHGTDFTVIGSNGDAVVPAASATHMTVPASNKVIYASVPHTGSNNYMHDPAVLARSVAALAYAGQ